ncbi:MAG: arginase family protein, partial [Pseudomonadota bacterium]|nr:arginase family protein [Pseudomonadota bacterium]
MSGHGYESGRLNLPFVGLCSFGKYPYQPDWNSIDADFAILGAPFDFGTQFRAGARFGPRGVREPAPSHRRSSAISCSSGSSSSNGSSSASHAMPRSESPAYCA